MIDPSPLIDSLTEALNSYGSSMTLTRLPSTTVALQGVARNYQPSEVAGGVSQGDRHVVIGVAEMIAASWPAPPVRGDQMLIGGRTFQVIAVDVLAVGGADVRYDIQVRGAA